jgi:hypothetical protein
MTMIKFEYFLIYSPDDDLKKIAQRVLSVSL